MFTVTVAFSHFFSVGVGAVTAASTAVPALASSEASAKASTFLMAFSGGDPAGHLQQSRRWHQLLACDDAVDSPPVLRRLPLHCKLGQIMDRAGYVLVG